MSEIDDYLKRMKAKDPLFEQKAELGRLLMRPMEDLTPEDQERFDELNRQISQAT